MAWVCAQCGQAMQLDEEKGLQQLELRYSSAIAPGAAGKPFWVCEGRVSMRRETYSGKETSEAERFWSQPRRFFVPASSLSLENVLQLGVALLLQPPALASGPAARFEPVTLSGRDILPTAEFIVMAVEANRKDKLKKLEFNLQLSAPVMWVLP
jgi:hypothetical protein